LVLKCEVAFVILHENTEASLELGDGMGWRILREKRKKSALQRTQILSDTEEASKDEEIGESENLLENCFVGTWGMLTGMWTEQVMMTRHCMVLNIPLKIGN
jgi:hypothetical protein